MKSGKFIISGRLIILLWYRMAQNPLTAVIHELTDRAKQCSLLIASWVGLVSASLQAVAFEHCPGILFNAKN